MMFKVSQVVCTTGFAAAGGYLIGVGDRGVMLGVAFVGLSAVIVLFDALEWI